MGLFDIFKSNSSSGKPSKSISSPFELFLIDFNQVPDNSFALTDEDENQDGTKTKTFSKELSQAELGLFDSLDIVVFESGGKNYIFKSSKFNPKDTTKLKPLVDQLFAFYGNDNLDTGKFSKEDQFDLKNGYWGGRMWTDETHEPHLMISWDEEEGLSLTIWTKKLQE